LYKKIII